MQTHGLSVYLIIFKKDKTMKLTNFKIVPFILAGAAFLALSGCDGTTGVSSDGGLVDISIPHEVTSTVTASPSSVVADGTATSTVTVTINDSNSTPVTDATVTLAQTGTSMISAVTNVGDGTYTFDVKSTTVETVTYTATADGVTITQTADVIFTMTESECLLAAGGYETIVMNGRTWLDRNLGASEAAADVNDTAAFGDLYQWGRSADGHQERTSENNDTLATTLDGSDTNTAWYGKFIGSNRANGDWVEPGVDNDGSMRAQSWSTPYDETTNPNQVCPCGYIVPVEQDFRDLNLITDANASDTFKLVYAQYRFFDDGRMDGINATAFWTTGGDNNLSVNAYYNSSNFESYVTNERGYGFSIRCIKPE